MTTYPSAHPVASSKSTAATKVPVSHLVGEGPITKRVWLDDAGDLQKAGRALGFGAVARVDVDGLPGLAHVLDQLGPFEALAFGVPHGLAAGIDNAVSLAPKDALDRAPEGAIARTKDAFGWHDGPGVMFIDTDGGLTTDDLSEALAKAAPDLAAASRITMPSAGAYITNSETGEAVTGLTGIHTYILVADARDIPRAGRVLDERMWLAGYGRTEITTAGTILLRSPVDVNVFTAEHVDYAAGADCEPPLVQKRGSAVVTPGAFEAVDTRRAIPDLSDAEKRRLRRLRKAAKDARADEAARVRAEWEAAQAARIAEHSGISIDAARAETTAVANGGDLPGEWPITVTSGPDAPLDVTVADLFEDAERFHGATCRDPIEPDYGNDTVGLISLDGIPNVFSFAHGGATYTMRSPAARAVFAGVIEPASADEPTVASAPSTVKPVAAAGAAKVAETLRDYGFVLHDAKAPVIRLTGPLAGSRTTTRGLIEQLAKYDFQVDGKNGAENVSIGRTWLKSKHRIDISEVTWDPTRPGGLVADEDSGTYSFNEFRAPEHAPEVFDPAAWAVFVELVENITHDDRERDWVLDALATKLRNPEVPGVGWLFVNRMTGSGRGTFVNVIRALVGEDNVNEVSPENFRGSDFTAFRARKLFHEVREVRAPVNASRRGSASAHEFINRLNTLIEPSASLFECNRKYVDARQERAHGTWIMATNNVDALPVPTEDRRFTILKGKERALRDAPNDLFDRINGFRTASGFTAAFAATVYNGLMAREVLPATFLQQKLEGTVGAAEMAEATADPAREVLAGVLKDFEGDYATAGALTQAVEEAMRADGEVFPRNVTQRLKHAMAPGNPYGWRRVPGRPKYRAADKRKGLQRATVYQREGAPAFEDMSLEDRGAALGAHVGNLDE